MKLRPTGAGALVVAALALGACSSSTVSDSSTTTGASTATTEPSSSSSLGASSSSTGAGGSSSSSTGSSSSSSTTAVNTGSSSTAGSGATTTAALDDALTALRDGDLTSFVAALRASGMLGDLTSTSVTIFAPNNAAFAALPGDTLKDLLANPTKIRPILENHIVEGTWTAERLATVSSVTAKSGRELPVSSVGGQVTVDGAKVVRVDSSGRQVLVHVIDEVLTETAG